MNLQVFSNFDTAATTSAVESLLLSPIHEVATQALSSAEEAIFHTGEFLWRSSPQKSSAGAKRPYVRFASEAQQAEKREVQSSTRRLLVDIQPRCDGTGIELIVNNNCGTAFKVKGNKKIPSIIRGSLLMIDSTSTELENKEILPMNLKILRGKNLPFDNTRIRIGVLNREGGAVDQIIGTTPSSEGSRDPIWGSRICSWTLNANHSTKFLFTLIQDNQGERKNSKIPATLCAKVLVANLLSKINPNFWIVLKDGENPDGVPTYGRLQIRLTRPTEAKLHKQENCRRITPGPAIPRMQSYAIRKMALYSCSPVILNVYDLSNNPRIQTINNTTKSFGYGGIFHAAIEIHGKEYSFGGTSDKKSKISGVFQCAPKKCPMHHYRESVFLGDCELNSQQIHSILMGLRPKWMATSYNVFRRNCACFSREFAIELGVGDLPEWVFSLATTAESIEPYLHRLNTYLKNRTKAAPPDRTSAREKITKLILPPASKEVTHLVLSPASKKVTINSHADIQAHEVAKNTQEALLDHAMAARIQRSFRSSTLRRASKRRAKALSQLQISTIASA